MTFVDRDGNEFTGHGMFAALSFDEGQTWPVRKLLTPGEGDDDGGAHTGSFTATPTRAEHAGYPSPVSLTAGFEGSARRGVFPADIACPDSLDLAVRLRYQSLLSQSACPAVPLAKPLSGMDFLMHQISLSLFALAIFTSVAPAADPARIDLSDATRQRCVEILREGLAGEDFWPAIHAAEGLTLGGQGEEVLRFLTPKLDEVTDDQQRCGIARELVRAGDRSQAQVLLDILAGDDDDGHVHAAESLFKVFEIGDGTAMRAAFAQTGNLRLRLMAAGALARCGHPGALEFLRKRVGHDDPEAFKIAVWLLGRIGEAQEIPLIRANRSRAPDELNRAYHDHSLAALGDPQGMAALGRNLASGDPAVRTYAATFAGDARAVRFQGKLEAMLDDPYPDARIRAAQSLLDLAAAPGVGGELPLHVPDDAGAVAPSKPASPAAPPADRREDVSVLVYEATEENPRYTEGSILELNDGSLLYAVTEFQGGGSDFARARIVARRSSDGGRTWEPPRVLQENTGRQNVMSVTLRRLRAPAPPGTIAMFYLEKNGDDDLRLLVRFSTDEAATFSEPVLVTAEPGYHVINNDRITQLSTGRLLAPSASTSDVRQENHFVSHCFLSDDGGRTWRQGKQSVDLPKRGAMEPEVIELAERRVMMLMRTQLGHISRSISTDGGETWSEPAPLGVGGELPLQHRRQRGAVTPSEPASPAPLGHLPAPEAPSTVRRIPATGDLLLIWNNTYVPEAGHGGRRTPLTAALSSDEGETWRIVGNLEENAGKSFSYVSLTFVRDRAVMSYWESSDSGRLSSRFRSLPVSRFYTVLGE